MASETGKIDAGKLITAITNLYKSKSSSVKDDAFKTAFEEANTNGNGVSTQKLLIKLEDVTGVNFYEFSQQEQEAINTTLNALSDDKTYRVFDNYDDINDISSDFLDELKTNQAVVQCFSEALNEISPEQQALNNTNEINQTQNNANNNTNTAVNNTQSSNNVNVEADINQTQNTQNNTDVAIGQSAQTEDKTQQANDYIKKIDRKSGYSLLVETNDGYRVQLYTKKGKFVKERKLVDADYEIFGLENPNKQQAQENTQTDTQDNQTVTAQDSSQNTQNTNTDKQSDNQTSSDNKQSEKIDGEIARKVREDGYSVLIKTDDGYKIQLYTTDGKLVKERDALESDWDSVNMISPETQEDIDTDVNANLAYLTKDSSKETVNRIASLQASYEQANSKEGIFGKMAGGIKNFLNTKYSPDNVQEKILELAKKGDSATQEEIDEVQKLVNKYCEKAGGGGEKTSNVTAIAGGILGGIGIAAAVVATAPVSIPTAVVGIIGTAGAFLVGGLCKMFTKQVEKNTDGIENNEFKGSDMASDTVSGGILGASAYNIFKSIPSAVKSLGGAIGNGAKAVGDAVVSGGKAILKTAGSAFNAVKGWFGF